MMIVATCILVLLLILVIPSLSPKRVVKLNAIIRDLRAIVTIPDKGANYAINENIAFFKAIRTLPGYFLWIAMRKNKIISSQLLEIADLSLPHWEKELYEDLAYVEGKAFPGLSKPLKNIILDYIKRMPDARILDLGSGGMEVERQVLMELSALKVECRVLFIGVDSAPQAWEAIQETFASTSIPIRRIESLEDLEELSISQPTVCFHCGDALNFADLYGNQFDLTFSSRFRHHLEAPQKQELDAISKKLSYVIEYDDYSSNFSWLPPLLTAWYRPILLNGAIFSQLRQPSKKDLVREQRAGTSHTSIRFFSPPGSYARIYKNINKSESNVSY